MRMDVMVALLGSVASTTGATVLAAADAIDPNTMLASLLVNGPLGVVTAYLLWRGRERDQEHARERSSAWEEVARMRDAVQRSMEEQTRLLVRIVTLLENRPGNPP